MQMRRGRLTSSAFPFCAILYFRLLWWEVSLAGLLPLDSTPLKWKQEARDTAERKWWFEIKNETLDAQGFKNQIIAPPLPECPLASRWSIELAAATEFFFFRRLLSSSSSSLLFSSYPKLDLAPYRKRTKHPFPNMRFLHTLMSVHLSGGAHFFH